MVIGIFEQLKLTFHFLLLLALPVKAGQVIHNWGEKFAHLPQKGGTVWWWMKHCLNRVAWFSLLLVVAKGNIGPVLRRRHRSRQPSPAFTSIIISSGILYRRVFCTVCPTITPHQAKPPNPTFTLLSIPLLNFPTTQPPLSLSLISLQKLTLHSFPSLQTKNWTRVALVA